MTCCPGWGLYAGMGRAGPAAPEENTGAPGAGAPGRPGAAGCAACCGRGCGSGAGPLPPRFSWANRGGTAPSGVPDTGGAVEGWNDTSCGYSKQKRPRVAAESDPRSGRACHATVPRRTCTSNARPGRARLTIRGGTRRSRRVLHDLGRGRASSCRPGVEIATCAVTHQQGDPGFTTGRPCTGH